VGIDHNEKVIFLKGPDGKDRPPIPYDVLSINIGITPKLMTSEEELDAKNIIPVKPISEFADRYKLSLIDAK
jgi:selenide,water dikinase